MVKIQKESLQLSYTYILIYNYTDENLKTTVMIVSTSKACLAPKLLWCWAHANKMNTWVLIKMLTIIPKFGQKYMQKWCDHINTTYFGKLTIMHCVSSARRWVFCKLNI